MILTLKTELKLLYLGGPELFLNDHKENFISNPKVILIYPWSFDLGRLNKIILDQYILFNNKYLALKNINHYFDITLGSINSIQITDLVGIYVLYHFYNEFPEIKGGHFRDNTLLYFY